MAPRHRTKPHRAHIHDRRKYKWKMTQVINGRLGNRWLSHGMLRPSVAAKAKKNRHAIFGWAAAVHKAPGAQKMAIWPFFWAKLWKEKTKNGQTAQLGSCRWIICGWVAQVPQPTNSKSRMVGWQNLKWLDCANSTNHPKP